MPPEGNPKHADETRAAVAVCLRWGSYFAVLANTVTLRAWRNGPVEGVHAGRFEGYALDERRMLPKAEKAIVHHAQGGVFAEIKIVDNLRCDDAWRQPLIPARPRRKVFHTTFPSSFSRGTVSWNADDR